MLHVTCRWYGDNEGDPNQEIFVERKTHHESWTGEKSSKERFSIPQKKVFEFMKGKLDMDEWARKESRKEKRSVEDKKYRNMLRLGHEIQDLIMREKLQPIVSYWFTLSVHLFDVYKLIEIVMVDIVLSIRIFLEFKY